MIGALVELLGKYYVNDDLNNVETIARSILAAVPDDQVSLQFIGLVYYRSGRIDEAVRLFSRVKLRQQPTLEEVAGPTPSRIAKRDNAATACYEAATRQNPHMARAWHDLGMTLQELGKFEHALRAFHCATLAHPEFAQAFLALSRTAMLANDLVGASRALQRLRELQPDNGEVYLGLARIHRKRREFAAARECLVRARELLGNSTEIAA